MKQEFVDIVDEKDECVLAVRTLQQVYDEELLAQTRGVKLFIKNSKGELLMARRSLKKERDAGKLDSPMTGHVQAGESYEEALFREAAEELDLDISQYDYRELGKLSAKEGVFSFVTVYEIELEDIPRYNTFDFEEMFWMKPVDIITAIVQGVPARKSLSIWLKHFYMDCCQTRS